MLTRLTTDDSKTRPYLARNPVWSLIRRSIREDIVLDLRFFGQKLHRAEFSQEENLYLKNVKNKNVSILEVLLNYNTKERYLRTVNNITFISITLL